MEETDMSSDGDTIIKTRLLSQQAMNGNKTTTLSTLNRNIVIFLPENLI